MSGIMMGACAGPGAFLLNRVIAADLSNYNLKTDAIASGWDGRAALVATVTINPGVVVSASSTAGHAFDTGTGFSVGSTLALINHGYICGMGGAGGRGDSGSPGTWPGANGGPALIARVPIAITNNGTIGGGGGGGGGAFFNGSDAFGAGGGGGRSGRHNAAAGPQTVGLRATAAGVGTFSGPGAGGYGENSDGTITTRGGAGGGWGGAGGVGKERGTNQGAGGAGGAAVVGNSNITWLVAGTRHGAIT